MIETPSPDFAYPRSSSQTDLRHHIAVVRQRKWWIIVTTAVFLAGTLILTFIQTPQYTSNTRVLVTPIGPAAQAAAASSPNPLNLDNESALAKSYAVASLVTQKLGLHQSPDSLISHLAVRGETNTDILDVQYTDTKPATAQRLSTAFSTQYLRFRQQQALGQIKSQSAGIQSSINQASAKLASLSARLAKTTDPARQSSLTAQRDTITARLGVLQQQLQNVEPSSTHDLAGQIVQPANLPRSPSSPNKFRNGILGIVLGLALGVGLAFLRERLDDRLRGRTELEEYVHAPVLATVPRVTGWRRRDETRVVALEDPKSPSAEAYRTLRTNLQFIARRPEFQIIGLTSPNLGEGKTTTAANLGVTLALAGKRVTIVSCDLRKPRLANFFGLESAVGVSSFLIGQTELTQALQQPEVEGMQLNVLGSGPVPPNPAELLASPEMDELLTTLRRTNDFIVIDTPPLVVADALILAPRCDGIVMVADAGVTTRGGIRHAREQLRQAGGHVVGAVLNNFDFRAASYHLEYGYYGYHSYGDKETASVSAGNGAGGVLDPTVPPVPGGVDTVEASPPVTETDRATVASSDQRQNRSTGWSIWNPDFRRSLGRRRRE